jgi:hypothetical protein
VPTLTQTESVDKTQTERTSIQADGGLSFAASMGVTMLMGWLMKEHARLAEKYPDA